jgi:hypothetical protein
MSKSVGLGFADHKDHELFVLKTENTIIDVGDAEVDESGTTVLYVNDGSEDTQTEDYVHCHTCDVQVVMPEQWRWEYA